MDFNMKDYKKFVDVVSDTTLQITLRNFESWVWSHIIPALVGLRQEDHVFKTSLGYM
jgi:hypothetical protein